MKKNPISSLFSLFSRYWALCQPDLTKPAPTTFSRLLLEIDLVAIGMIVSCYFFYPGCLSGDAKFSWNEATSNLPVQYNLHPPLVAYSYRLLNNLPFSFIPQYADLFMAMNLFYWSGLVLVLRPWFRHKLLWIMGFLIIGFFPTAFGILSQPIKDSLMCAALMMTYGCFLAAERENSKFAFGTGIVFLFLALGYRHNALFAVLPFALWAGILTCRRILNCPWWKKTAAGTLILAPLFAGISIFNYALIENNVFPIQQLFAFDLVGITVKTNTVYVPDVYNDNTKPPLFPPMYQLKGASIPGDTNTISNIFQLYVPDSNHNFIWNGPGKGLRFLDREEDITTLRKAWLNAIVKEPIAYLKVRSAFFSHLIGLSRSNFLPYFCVPMDHFDLEIESQKELPSFYQKIMYTWWVKGISYISVITFLFGIACWKRHIFPLHMRIVGASGLIYATSYFFIGITSEFRLLYWLIPVSLIMAIDMLFTVITRKQTRAAQ